MSGEDVSSPLLPSQDDSFRVISQESSMEPDNDSHDSSVQRSNHRVIHLLEQPLEGSRWVVAVRREASTGRVYFL